MTLVVLRNSGEGFDFADYPFSTLLFLREITSRVSRSFRKALNILRVLNNQRYLII